MSFLDNAGLAYLWGKIKSYIAGTAFSMNPATSIPENSNLNSYTTLGTYYSVNSANTATIVNSPLTGSGFVLYVMRHAEGGNIYQFVIGNSTQLPIYSRIYVTSTGTWHDWNKLARGIDVISDSHPADTATAAQCLAYAQARPNVMFTWAKWSPATYTPVQTSASWVYTLYTTYTDDAQYIVFEAQNNTNGNLYRCKADGTWVRLAMEADVPVLARETFDVKTSFTAGTIGTRGSQVTIDASKAGYTLIGAWIVYIEDSSSYHPLVFRARSPATRVYVNVYRCVSTAVNDIDVTVECLYLKN